MYFVLCLGNTVIELSKITVIQMQKIKRTDVRKKVGKKSFLKIILIIMIFILLFVIGFFAAAYITKNF